jgi:hypothetical protein
VIIERPTFSLILLLATFGFLPVLNAQATNDGSQKAGTQAITRPDKEEPPDNYQNHVKYPQPYVYGGLGLNRGGGYSLASGNVGIGLMMNTQHFIWNAVATYDNARKVADGTGNNPKGHDRGLASSAYYKFPFGLFLGAGASWSQLSTTNYSKQSWNRTMGIGWDYLAKECAAEDCVVNWSLRAQVDYLFKGSEHVNRQGCSVPKGKCTNGVEGPKFVFYLPSPMSNSHFIFRGTLGVYDAHATVTSIDPELTAAQIGQRSRAVFVEYTLMYRF